MILFIASSLDAQLNPDRHTTSPTDAWKSCQEAMNPNGETGMSHWVKFDFETINNITDIKIWNLNDPSNLNEGVQTLRIDYSTDNINWTEGGTFSVSQSDGSAFYEGEIVGNLNGAPTRYLILTAEDNYGGTCTGISEARFYTGLSVPVELASFEGSCETGERELEWSFADISDFESLDIEWSANGIEWERIYTRSSVGSQDNTGNYSGSWEDKRNTTSNKNFYRLKMNDSRGYSQYSEVEVVSCKVMEQDITIYPQPVSDEMTINLDLIRNSEVTYTLRDILGQKVGSGIWDANEGLNQYKLNVGDLVSGQYIIEFEVNNEKLQKKFLKQ